MRKAAASSSLSDSGASNTPTAGATVYSAMPPSASFEIPTTRRPIHCSAPAPAPVTTPHTSMPSVKGGCLVTETSFPRHRSMSLKFNAAAATRMVTSPAAGSGTSTSFTASTSPGGP